MGVRACRNPTSAAIKTIAADKAGYFTANWVGSKTGKAFCFARNMDAGQKISDLF
jgi:hypothetical protein